jgi:ribonuclease BN (tRNA processing enzyme)
MGSRQTCCYCLELSGRLIIFDAGTGMSRFGEPWARGILEKYDTVYLFLSHYHLDHISGLIYLPRFFRGKNVHIAGPGQAIYRRGVSEILGNLISPPYFGRSLTDFPMDLSIHDLGAGGADIDGIGVETVLQEHTSPSIGIKINGAVSYITDTACTAGTVDLVRGSRLLLHETWFDWRDYEAFTAKSKTDPEAARLLQSHSPLPGVVEIARDAGVETLLLIHLNPTYNENRYLEMERAARAIFPGARLAVDAPLDEHE